MRLFCRRQGRRHRRGGGGGLEKMQAIRMGAIFQVRQVRWDIVHASSLIRTQSDVRLD